MNILWVNLIKQSDNVFLVILEVVGWGYFFKDIIFLIQILNITYIYIYIKRKITIFSFSSFKTKKFSIFFL